MWGQFICIFPVNSGRGSSVLVWLKVIQWCVRKGRVVLNVPGEELDCISNCAEKVFSWVGNGGLVGGSINLKFLPDFRQLKDHYFGFIWHSIREEVNSLNDVIGNSLEFLSWLNWSVSRHMGGIFSGYFISNRKSGLWVYTGRVWDIVPDVQGKIAFRRRRSACGRLWYRVIVRHECWFLIGYHRGLRYIKGGR